MVYKNAPVSFHTQYIIGRALSESPPAVWSNVTLSKALRYPLCTIDVLDTIYRIFGRPLASGDETYELPRRLFRRLSPKLTKSGTDGVVPVWMERDHPLPFLKYLYESDHFPPPNVNAHEGYALTKAVHAGFLPLVHFLLHHGASPRYKDGLVVLVAIRKKDLSLVKLLIEKDDSLRDCRGKRRRMEDRMQVNSNMLKAAVKCGATDIVHYLTEEKGCVPDIATLHMIGL
jgi:hypothetical protein